MSRAFSTFAVCFGVNVDATKATVMSLYVRACTQNRMAVESSSRSEETRGILSLEFAMLDLPNRCVTGGVVGGVAACRWTAVGKRKEKKQTLRRLTMLGVGGRIKSGFRENKMCFLSLFRETGKCPSACVHRQVKRPPQIPPRSTAVFCFLFTYWFSIFHSLYSLFEFSFFMKVVIVHHFAFITLWKIHNISCACEAERNEWINNHTIVQIKIGCSCWCLLLPPPSPHSHALIVFSFCVSSAAS